MSEGTFSHVAAHIPVEYVLYSVLSCNCIYMFLFFYLFVAVIGISIGSAVVVVLFGVIIVVLIYKVIGLRLVECIWQIVILLVSISNC